MTAGRISRMAAVAASMTLIPTAFSRPSLAAAAEVWVAWVDTRGWAGITSTWEVGLVATRASRSSLDRKSELYKGLLCVFEAL